MDQSTAAALPRRSGGLRKFFTFFILIFLLLAALFIWWRYYSTYSDGSRYGLLQKFSHRGNIFKTYEGEMILSSVRGNSNVPLASEKFYFSVTEDRIAQQMMNMQGHEVTVHYKQKRSAVAWRGDSEYIVDSIRVEH